MTMRLHKALMVILLTAMWPAVSMANNLLVTRHFTGIWNQPDHESQGLAIQLVEQWDDSRLAVVYWYTFGSDRRSAWYLGVGLVDGNRIDLSLFNAEDVGFLQMDLPGDESVEHIGTMTIVFEDCQHGSVTYASDHAEVGSGSFRIERMLEIMNTHCSGGISDDMHADAMHGSQRIELLPAREGIMARGHARYADYPGRSEFEVEITGLPDGQYYLFSGVNNRGEFTIHEGFGEMEFHSPAQVGMTLLTFDPRGMRIEIHDEAGAVMSSMDQMFDEYDYRFSHDEHGHVGDDDHDFRCHMGHGMGHGAGHGGNHGDSECVDEGEIVEIHADLANTGAIPSATGDAEWEMTSHRIEFKVDIEDVPTGTYALLAGGEAVGEIEAVDMHGTVAGMIRFRDPEMVGAEHLDFDPRGQLIQVMQDGVPILEVEFPEL